MTLRTVNSILTLVLGAAFPMTDLFAQTQPNIKAIAGFDAPPCSNVDLGGDDIVLSVGPFSVTIQHVPSPWRGNPEWKTVILDPSKTSNLQPPTILEGFVAPQPNDQNSTSQSTSEVAEEDLGWTHYSHDFTFKVVPDNRYFHLLSSWVNADGTIGTHTDMEVEWDSASLMDEKEGFGRIWGSVPEFVWPIVGDRVWVSGRWIFDCGHPSASDMAHVQFSTEIHPPRALVAFRLNHVALDSFPTARISAPNFPYPQSYLPVTGQPADPAAIPPGLPNSGPTNIPVTEADIYVSGNGSLANDLCSLVSNPCPGHTGPIVPVNDRNYVFDVYPPGTGYFFTNPNGTFRDVAPPVSGASLQWRIVDHFSELPAHACGGVDNSVCVTVDPIICLLDASTPAPNQTEKGCPAVPANPTRLRVILPFAGSSANFFAKSILLGWDDVPNPSNHTPSVRTFQVRLHDLTVKNNGEGCCKDGDWRVFVNVGGQYRYMSRNFDAKGDGTSVCNGADPLPENGNYDCYRWDNTPFTVSVEDGTPIHVAVGGFVARGVEDSSNPISMCRNYPGGCDAPTDLDPLHKPYLDFALYNDDRIGTYEFDLVGPDYTPPALFTTGQFGCSIFSITGCSLRYHAEFNVQEVPPATPPLSDTLTIGNPKFVGSSTYISSSTPLIPHTTDPNVEGFQYRFHLQGAPLPTYATSPFPIHWAHADLSPSAQSVVVTLDGANAGDGPYDFQYSAESFGNLLEPRHTATVVLDTTPPAINIVQPQATTYTHSATLTLNYNVSDGTGCGVASFTPTMDGSATLPGGVGLQSGQAISLLTELALGPHTFSIRAADNIGNSGSQSVAFSIVVTAQSIQDDVTQFVASGAITQSNEGNSLLSKLVSAAKARANGNCPNGTNIYQSFISEVTAQTGKKIDPAAGAILIADANYLIAHCP